MSSKHVSFSFDTEFKTCMLQKIAQELYDDCPTQLLSRALAGSFCVVSAAVEGEIIAIGRAISDGASDAYIEEVLPRKLSPFHQPLMEKLIGFCQAKELEWIGALVPSNQKKFYQALGFTPMDGTVFRYAAKSDEQRSSIQDEIEFRIIRTAPLFLEQIVSLYRTAGWWNETPLAHQHLPKLIQGSYCFIVALIKAQVLGMGRMLSDGCSRCYIQDVIVKEEVRGRQIGRRIMHKLIAYALKDNLKAIFLVAERGSAAFYAKLNFQIEGNLIPMVLTE